MKIRTKLLIVLLSITIIGGILGYYASDIITREIVIQTISNYNSLLAKAHINSIDRIIYRRLERWEAYAKSNQDLVDFLKADNLKFDNLDNREQYIKSKDELWKNLNDEDRDELIDSSLNNTIAEGLQLRTKFYKEKNGYDIFPEFFITNKYGATIAATNKTSDYNQADEEWWQKAADKGSYVSDISFDASSGVYSLELCIRIEDEVENFLGVAKIIYNIKDIFEVVDEIKDTSGEYKDKLGMQDTTVNARLMTKDGRLIYSIKDGFGNLTEQKVLLSYVNDQKNKSVDYYIASENGSKKLFNYAGSDGYKDFKSLGWILVIDKDTREILAPVDQIAQTSMTVISLVIFLLCLLVIFFVNYLIRPLRLLQRGTEIIEKGDLNYKVGMVRKDEIGQLSRSFDKMVMAIKKSRSEVDRKVEEQTKEIRDKSEELERSNKLMIGRELKMAELKREINKLKKQKSD